MERKHNSSDGTLTPAGRDVEDDSPVALRFDNGIWTYLGPKSGIDWTKNQNAVLTALKNSETPLSFGDIVKASGVNNNSLGRVLESLTSQGVIKKLTSGGPRGTYQYIESMQVNQDDACIE